MGLGLVGGVYTNKSKATLDQTTPVARLTEEPEIVVVAKDSPYQSFDQLLAAWKADPGKVSVGGGSSAGPDHLAPMLIAQRPGSTPSRSTSSPTTAAASCWRPCSAARSPSASPGSARPRTRSRPARSGRSR